MEVGAVGEGHGTPDSDKNSRRRNKYKYWGRLDGQPGENWVQLVQGCNSLLIFTMPYFFIQKGGIIKGFLRVPKLWVWLLRVLLLFTDEDQLVLTWQASQLGASYQVTTGGRREWSSTRPACKLSVRLWRTRKTTGHWASTMSEAIVTPPCSKSSIQISYDWPLWTKGPWTLDRPIRIPRSRLDILKRLNETFASWFNILAETVILRFFNQKSGSIQLDLILTRDVQMVDLTLTRVLAQTMILCNLRLNQNMRPMNQPQWLEQDCSAQVEMPAKKESDVTTVELVLTAVNFDLDCSLGDL